MSADLYLILSVLLPKEKEKKRLIPHWIALPCSLQGIKNSANCLREIYPHCIFDHAWPRPIHGAGTESETDGPPSSVATGSRANRALLQNRNTMAAARARGGTRVNLSAEFHAEIQAMNMPGPLCLHERREGPQTRGCCSQFCPANNGPKPESIQSPRSCDSPLLEHFLSKPCTHTHTNRELHCLVQ